MGHFHVKSESYPVCVCEGQGAGLDTADDMLLASGKYAAYMSIAPTLKANVINT